MNRTWALAALLAPTCGYPQAGDLSECLIEPSVEVSLSSPVSGVIETILVDRGDVVTVGQELVRLRSDVERAAVELAIARLEFGQRKVERTQSLFQEDFASEYSVDEALTEARLAEVELSQAWTVLRQKTLNSPIQGVVVDRLMDAGEFVADHEIMRIARLDPLHVEVVMPVEQLDAIRVGMRATVYPGEPVGGEYTATVATVDRVLDAASGTFRVRLALPNPRSRLPAGLRCTVRIHG